MLTPQEKARIAQLLKRANRGPLPFRLYQELANLIGSESAEEVFKVPGRGPETIEEIVERSRRRRRIIDFPPEPPIEPPIEPPRGPFVYRRMIELLTANARQRRYHVIRVDSLTILRGRALELAFAEAINDLREILSYGGVIRYIDPASAGRSLTNYAPFNPLEFGGSYFPEDLEPFEFRLVDDDGDYVDN